MGGSAFKTILPESLFPRMPLPVYRDLKALLTPRLLELYEYVATPEELPEKVDFGDLDFIVCTPKIAGSNPEDNMSVAPETLKEVLGAKEMIPMPANRTSNFAVPVQMNEWEALGCGEDEACFRKQSGNREMFYQIDIHVCKDKDEWTRLVFFHSYGDMNMILGVIAANAGLHLSHNCLKIKSSPWKPTILSTDLEEILNFMTLSMDTFHHGFKTNRAVFEWLATSQCFDSTCFRTDPGDGVSKVKPDRTNYTDFVKFVEEQKRAAGMEVGSSISSDSEDFKKRREAHRTSMREKALLYFGKKEEHEAEMRQNERQKQINSAFSGSVVKEVTGLKGGQWEMVRMVTRKTREIIGDEDDLLNLIEKEGKDGIVRAIKNAEAQLLANSDYQTLQARDAANGLEQVSITD